MTTIAPNQRRRLRLVLSTVFVLLLIPTITLAYLGYRQLQFESFYQHQSMAVEVTGRIERRASALFDAEDAKSFVDYGFLIVGEGNYVQRSALSTFPVEGDLPGLVSYFQVDADGTFSTPLLPKVEPDRDVGPGLREAIEPEEYSQRLELQNKVRQQLERLGATGTLRSDLSEGDAIRLVDAAADSPQLSSSIVSDDRPQPELVAGQKIFERLNAPKEEQAGLSRSIAELKLDYVQSVEDADDANEARYGKPAGKDKLRARRVEKNVDASVFQDERFANVEEARLKTFESEVDPFRFDVIDGSYFVLYRNVWRDQQRFVLFSALACYLVVLVQEGRKLQGL